MDTFILKDISNQPGACDNNFASDVLSSTNAQPYTVGSFHIDNAPNCEYNVTTNDNYQCPVDKPVATYYPLLNTVTCCASFDETIKSKSNNIPSNYDYVENKFYQMGRDTLPFHSDPYFFNDPEVNKCVSNINENNVDGPIMAQPQPNINIEPFHTGNNTLYFLHCLLVILLIFLFGMIGMCVYKKYKK